MRFLLKEYMAINRISNFVELEKLTGFTKSTLFRRMKHPEELKLFEIRVLDEVLHFSDEDLARLVRCEFDSDVSPKAAVVKRTA